jgi:hypothetical protein
MRSAISESKAWAVATMTSRPPVPPPRLGGRLGEGALAGSGSAQDEGKRQDALQIARPIDRVRRNI